MRRPGVLAIVCACLFGAGALGASVPFQITSISGRSVYIDKGRGSGLTVGMKVRVLPPGAEAIELIVSAVSTNSARLDVPEGMVVPDIGVAGEADVPDDAATPADGQDPKRAEKPPVPEHPPWQGTVGERAPDQPLLAPAYARPANERPRQFHGRVFAQGLYTHDQSGADSNDYYLTRLGTSMDLTNPFGQGGRLSFSGELNHRGQDVLNDGTSGETNAIVDRLSYSWGGEQYSPHRTEVGRFMSYYVPELGTIDGVESALIMENDVAVGGALGLYPRSYPDRDWGEDFGFHAFIDYRPKGDHHLSTTLAYQKTWHDGKVDRDLLVGKINMAPSKSWWVSGSAKVDLYTPGDPVKGTGPSLTELWLFGRYAPTEQKWGTSLSLSRYSYADVKNRDFAGLPRDLVADGHVERADLSGWYDLRKDLRATARVNYWTDQIGNGKGGELDLDWDRVGGSNVTLHGDVFLAEGAFSKGEGFRLEARPTIGEVFTNVGYEYYRFEPTGLTSGGSAQVRHTARAGVNWAWRKMYYSATLDYMFGDAQNTYSLGFFAQYRF